MITKFNIIQATVSKLFISWANFLSCILGSQRLWPTREQVKREMPRVFREKFPNVRVVIDCTEIYVQTPWSLLRNSEMFSNYKKNTTFKCLIGITPAGAVSFVSTLYCGNISDKHITRMSGLLDLLEEGDDVMADKGFVIDDLLTPKGCGLIIPHFLSSYEQFTEEQNIDNQAIANARVHVERAIRRVKEFHFFDSPLPLNVAGSINQIWSICCLLTNFQGPLIKDRG